MRTHIPLLRMYVVRALIALTVLTVTAQVTGAGQTSARPSASVVPMSRCCLTRSSQVAHDCIIPHR